MSNLNQYIFKTAHTIKDLVKRSINLNKKMPYCEGSHISYLPKCGSVWCSG